MLWISKWECIVCGWIYDEELGWPEDGIEPEPAGRIFQRISLSRVWCRQGRF